MVFLDSIASLRDLTTKTQKLTILLEFMHRMATNGGGVPAESFTEFNRLWVYAVQAEDYDLRLLLPNALASLLKLVSDEVRFESVGIRLCQMALGRKQVMLANDEVATATGTANAHRAAAYISLLTEVTTFGGGACASAVCSRRLYIHDNLDAFLNDRRPHAPAEAGCTQSIRTLAIRYLLAQLRYQSDTAKNEILQQPRFARAVFDGIPHDPPFILIQLLDSLWTNAISGLGVKRSLKQKLLPDTTLANIAALYDYPERENDPASRDVAEAAHKFLVSVCTARAGGVLVTQYGWYPPLDIEMGLDASAELQKPLTTRLRARVKYTGRVPVRNTTLASFLQGLRPYANRRECQLAVIILKSAPELVADYFMRKRNFLFDPKMSSTWIGYNAFLFRVLKLPMPHLPSSEAKYLRNPPPTSIMLESVLPQPMNRRTMTKVLSHSHELIQMLGLKLIRAAFHKLEIVLDYIKFENTAWAVSVPVLLEQFSQRCPDIKFVLARFQGCTRFDSLMKDMTTSVLALYVKYIPQLVVPETFDISMPLVQCLHDNDLGERNQGSKLRKLELLQFLTIACCASNMRWWYKPGMAFHVLSIKMLMLGYSRRNAAITFHCNPSALCQPTQGQVERFEGVA